MDWKKIAVVWIFALIVSAMAGFGIAGAIDAGNDTTANPTPNTAIELAKEDSDAIKEWYAIESVGDSLFVEDVKNYEEGSITFVLYKEGLFNGAETGSTSLFKCVDVNAESGECLRETEKTTAELDEEKKKLVEAKISSVAETAKTRLAGSKTAVVGKGEITVKEK